MFPRMVALTANFLTHDQTPLCSNKLDFEAGWDTSDLGLTQALLLLEHSQFLVLQCLFLSWIMPNQGLPEE